MDFKVGDKVKVLEKIGYFWVDGMDETVGDVGFVTETDKDMANVRFSNDWEWWYAMDGLKKVEGLINGF